MKTALRTIVIALVILNLPGLANAVTIWDDDRAGVTATVTVGPSFSILSQDIVTPDGEYSTSSGGRMGLFLSGRAGFAPNHRWAFHGVGQVSFYSVHSTWGEEVFIIDSFLGAGFSYFFGEEPGSWYAAIEGGLTTWQAQSDILTMKWTKPADPWTSPAVVVSMGYEVHPHYVLEGSVCFAKPSGDWREYDVVGTWRDLDVTTNITSARLSIGYTWY
ncbi:MAG: hypothetical protein JXB46_02820 [Candidatus Eisenbacteria bacterium]|nr:hypothetical protein [Candidatus Eisenbacteria bacterium]